METLKTSNIYVKQAAGPRSERETSPLDNQIQWTQRKLDILQFSIKTVYRYALYYVTHMALGSNPEAGLFPVLILSKNLTFSQ